MNHNHCGRANIMDVINKGETYLTFVFDGMDSTQLKIASVSSGGTYETPILPSFSDNYLEVDGYDGRYYFNTKLTQKDFSYNCFIDNLSAQDFEQLKSWLRPKRIGKLVRPEDPYVYYWVKISSIDTLGNIPLTHPETGGVSYTGNFSITFSTVGQACGYGTCYFKDDLKYYEYLDIMTEAPSYYNTGLLYKESMPAMKQDYQSGTFKPLVYNPGTYSSRLGMVISFSENVGTGSIVLKNETAGDISIITLEDILAGSELKIDWEKNKYTLNGDDFTNNVSGDIMYLKERAFTETLEGGFVSNDGNQTTIYFNASERKVRTEDIGKTIMFDPNPGENTPHGLGAKIIGVDTAANTFLLDKTIGLLLDATTSATITLLDDISLDISLPENITINIEWQIKPRYL